VPNKNGPIGQMLLEHAEGRKHIAAMDASLQNGVLDGAAFAAAAENYITLLRAHISKENNILFPMGDRLLPAAQQQLLLKQFEEHEETVMGKGTHEKLHKLLDQFEEKYLK
jgi:hemerythrin-like domain-containing protein